MAASIRRTMTVAAAILSATAEEALADTLGQPRVRRLADIAWAGGALPVIVVSPDVAGTVAKSLAGAEATHGLPAPEAQGPAGQMLRAADLAMADVRETSAVLLWPARMTWIGPETITSLIEAHGTDREAMLRPAWHGDPGWPVLLPTTHLAALRAIASDRLPPAIVDELATRIPTRIVEVGDPGVTHDVETPRDVLPRYEGPPDPPAGHRHEWGEDVEAEAGLASLMDERR